MNKDHGIGAAILIGSVVGLVLYVWLIYALALVVLQITAFVAVAALLVIAAWIGWTMATTPPPAPLEPEQSDASTETSGGKVD